MRMKERHDALLEERRILAEEFEKCLEKQKSLQRQVFYGLEELERRQGNNSDSAIDFWELLKGDNYNR